MGINWCLHHDAIMNNFKMRNAKNSKNNVFNCIFCVKIGTGNNFDLNLHLSHGGTILDILTHFYVLFFLDL